MLIEVVDDDHWPSYLSGGSWWEYDQTEVYFDVNDELEDGLGITTENSGHYQAVGKFSAGKDGELQYIEVNVRRPVGQFAYVVTGESYVIEYAFDINSFKNKDGSQLNFFALKSLDAIGFDVTVIDQDEGITTGRQRAVWHNIGGIDENYGNMDDAGTITSVDEIVNGIDENKTHTLSTYPNPVTDILTVDATFDKVMVTNILGIQSEYKVISNNRIDMSSLVPGFYFIQVFDKGKLVGVSNFYKQ